MRVIVSSHSHAEVLTIQQLGNIVRWRLTFPPGLEGRDQGVEGEVDVGHFSIEREFESVIKSQSDSSQRERISVTSPHWPTFVLFLESENGPRVSWPLTYQEHKEFVGAEIVKRVSQDILSRNLLLKPHQMLDFFQPDRRRRLADPKKKPE